MTHVRFGSTADAAAHWRHSFTARRVRRLVRCCLPTIVLLAVGGAAFAQAGKWDMAPPARFGFAGIKLALPKDFALQVVNDTSDVFFAGKLLPDESSMTVRLTVMAQEDAFTLARLADLLQPDPTKPKNLALRNIKIVKTSPMRVAGGDGLFRILTYSDRGVDTTALRLFFERPFKCQNEKLTKLQYALTVAATKERGKDSLSLLGTIADTIELLEPVHPLAEKVELSPDAVPTKYGFSMRPPALWKLSATPATVDFSQTDYLNGGLPLPYGTAFCVAIKDTAQQFATRLANDKVRQFKDSLKRDLKLLPQDDVKLGGRDGCRIVAVAEPLPEQPGTGVIVVQQCIALEGKCYGIQLTMATDKPQEVMDVVATIASGFALTDVTTGGPTSGPGSRPATSPPNSSGPTTTSAPATAPAATPPSTTPPKTTAPATNKVKDPLEELLGDGGFGSGQPARSGAAGAAPK